MDGNENDTNDSQEKEFSEAISQKRKMNDLLENENFKFFSKILNSQIEQRIHNMLVMPEGMDDAVKRIYSSGEIAGMKIALNLPQILIETSQGTIDMIKTNEGRNENG